MRQENKENTIFKDLKSQVLPIISIIVAVIGIVGYWVFDSLTKNLGKLLSEGNFIEENLEGLITKYQNYLITQVCFSSLIFVSLILVLISQYRKKVYWCWLSV